MKPPTLAQIWSAESWLAFPLLDKRLSSLEEQLLAVTHARWPTSSLEIAEFLGHTLVSREQKRLLSSRITYHIKKLVEKKKLMSKRVGNALVVWPYEIEPLRGRKGIILPPTPFHEKEP